MVRRRKNDADRRFRWALSRAARALGWIVPDTDDEVRKSEERRAGESELPPALLDPFRALERKRARFAKASAAQSSESLTDELARAAREGRGEISEEVEERMRRDRAAAEGRAGGEAQ